MPVRDPRHTPVFFRAPADQTSWLPPIPATPALDRGLRANRDPKCSPSPVRESPAQPVHYYSVGLRLHARDQLGHPSSARFSPVQFISFLLAHRDSSILQFAAIQIAPEHSPNRAMIRFFLNGRYGKAGEFLTAAEN